MISSDMPTDRVDDLSPAPTEGTTEAPAEATADGTAPGELINLMPSAAVDAGTVRRVFETFLDRTPAQANVDRIVGEQRTVRQLEKMLFQTKEHRLSGPLLHGWFRTHFDCAMLLLPSARVLFCPIAKVANTSIKHWFVTLSGQHVQPPALVHSHIDEGRSGLQAQQFAFSALAPIFASPDWARIAVVRDPVQRVISAYWDKFVRNRTNLDVLHHTGGAYLATYGEDEIRPGMLDQGISFRQFCQFLAHSPREQTDPHWAPQHHYLENYRWDRLFDMDRISEFEDFIRARLPEHLQDVPLGLTNAAPRDPEAAADVPKGSFANRLPNTLDGISKPPDAAFLTDDIRRFLEDYYGVDLMLIERARTR